MSDVRQPSTQDGHIPADSASVAAPAPAAVIAHVKQLLRAPAAPELPPELAAVEHMEEIQAFVLEIRDVFASFASGDFSTDIRASGAIASRLKSLQANMRHLLKQIKLVEQGDLDQRVEFMGDFAAAFNSMVRQLATALNTLRLKETELVVLRGELQRELDTRIIAMNNLQSSEEKFRYLAEHDPLTNIFNRRSFFTRAEISLREHAALRQSSAIALLDVDNFKRFNDTHGHVAGDKALRHLAELLSALLRPGDLMGRFGGEEFVIFFRHASLENGARAAERLRGRIEKSPLQLDDKTVTITASFGVTAMPPLNNPRPEFDLLEFAVGLADSALYQAKAQGRNRVETVVFPEQILGYVSV